MARREWLERKITIYVPSTYNNHPISNAEYKRRVRDTVSYFTKKYHGTTRVKAVGTWENPYGMMVEERIARVDVFIDAPVWAKNKGKIYEWVRQRRILWGQTSVAFEKDTMLTFIEKPPKKKLRVPQRKPARRKRGLASWPLSGY